MKGTHITQPIEFAGDDRWELVHRILRSSQFASSARLRDFLIHVSVCALRDTPEEATEQQVGIHVFQRRPGFNTSEDSIVRSQARLLRIKLAAYFASEGASEEIRIEIPRGRYLPEFLPAPGNQINSILDGDVMAGTHLLEPDAGSMRGPRLLTRRQNMASVLPIPLAKADLLPSVQRPDGPSPLDVFWRPIFSGPRPMVIYSNEPFAGSYKKGLRYARSNHRNGSPDSVFDHFTGTGEVQSVFHITRLFERSRVDFALKRSALVPWDEAKVSNLIFIGSATENSALRVLPAAKHFHLAPGASAITNLRPFAGEPKKFCRSGHPITRDYAILSVGPGMMPSRYALVFAGLTTLGTQAAVEFACHSETVSDLLPQIVNSGTVRPFEAILEVSITGGVPLQTRLVAVRVCD